MEIRVGGIMIIERQLPHYQWLYDNLLRDWQFHENLDFRPARHTGGPIAVPYTGYRSRHQNQNGPVKELRDMSMTEIRVLGDKYGFSVGDVK
jgi:hypothetical protein